MLINGKKTCEVLKSVRKLIAEANGIPYTQPNAVFKQNAQARVLTASVSFSTSRLNCAKKKKAGNVLKIIGVAAGGTVIVACQEAKAQENVEDTFLVVNCLFLENLKLDLILMFNFRFFCMFVLDLISKQ